MTAGGATAQEYISYAKPGVKAVAIYDKAGGKKVGEIKPEKVVNLRIQAKQDDWREVDLDNGTFWIAASDVTTRMGPTAKTVIKPADISEGANSGFRRKN
jgi:hypothetical protein